MDEVFSQGHLLQRSCIGLRRNGRNTILTQQAFSSKQKKRGDTKEKVCTALLKPTHKTNKNQHFLDEERSLHCSPANRDSAAQALILHKALITHPSLQSKLAWAMKHKQSRHPHIKAGLRDEFPDLLGHILPHSSITAPWLKNANQQSSSMAVVWVFFFNTELQIN